ncbi:YjjG family noncanonical pyrimidine nucleotidase [Enterococcus sp. CSURQ0835]|uniref:YjjG family noncanonical pyrimidine nucleotidase n=1 Tax=Enterococcus sp. CSURQ0835 TaxID=2681394 RepID=UPI00135AA042|nr:YjjG family noncanonical pyrimidine nucleotidase [Enterococcus sp. CSURQ0835]
MHYHTLLFDVDDTLLDFKAAEDQALKRLFHDMGVPLTPAIKQAYQTMNQNFWREYELGQLTRQELLDTRFHKFFSQYDKVVDGPAVEECYRKYLNEGHDLYEDSLAVIKQLALDYDLYVVTNGVGVTQRQRLRESGLAPYFKAIFISEELGVNKPMKEFFTKVFAAIPNFSKNETVIIGDSLTSDIKGGINAGIDTIWLNPQQAPATEINPTYQIQHLAQLPKLLSQTV